MNKLKFNKGNAKLSKKISTFSIPSGKTCPGANECKSMAIRLGGKTFIKDGPACRFRCFSASQEVVYRNVYDSRQHNLEVIKSLIRSVPKLAKRISEDLPNNCDAHRIHVAGDFFSQNYFDAWVRAAKLNPSEFFYAYTKSLPFWVKRLGSIPSNLVLTASRGGKYDGLIKQHNLRSARVVFSADEAAKRGLKIDKDDSLAMTPGVQEFALLLHGTQPKGSESGQAWAKIKATTGGYSR